MLMPAEQLVPRLLLDPGLQVVRTQTAGPVIRLRNGLGTGFWCGPRVWSGDAGLAPVASCPRYLRRLLPGLTLQAA